MESHPYTKPRGVGPVTTQLTPDAEPASSKSAGAPGPWSCSPTCRAWSHSFMPSFRYRISTRVRALLGARASELDSATPSAFLHKQLDVTGLPINPVLHPRESSTILAAGAKVPDAATEASMKALPAISANSSHADSVGAPLRCDWTREEVRAIYQEPLLELVFDAQQVHRKFHDPAEVQLCQLLSIKTGGCPEDCAYCPQSAHYQTGVDTRTCWR